MMAEKRGVLVHPKEAKVFMDQQELCREYFRTEKITFGGLDPGHAEADEIFYCIQGHVLVHFPEDDSYHEMEKGDALLIPPATGHQITNIGQEEAVISWSCAPHP